MNKTLEVIEFGSFIEVTKTGNPHRTAEVVLFTHATP
jgi:hypothetical protein